MTPADLTRCFVVQNAYGWYRTVIGDHPSIQPERTLSVDDRLVKVLSRLHAAAYRMTRGAIGRRLVDNDMLLLTTVGRSSGSPHTVPLLYLRDDDRLVVVASYGGRDHHPEWYRNLVATPKARVQVRGDVRPIIATTMAEGDRSVWWPRFVDTYSDYATYQARTDREIPLVWLDSDLGAR